MAIVRTRKRGRTYSYIFEAGQVNGKRKTVEKSGFRTKEDAYNAGVDAYTDFKHGNIGIVSDHITLKAYMDNWLQGVASVNVRESSLAQYQKITKYHVTPLIGDIDIQDLTPAILDRWMQQLTRKGLAQKSLKLILAILRQALNYAVYPSNLIQSNPALYIKVPRTAPRDLVKRNSWFMVSIMYMSMRRQMARYAICQKGFLPGRLPESIWSAPKPTVIPTP